MTMTGAVSSRRLGPALSKRLYEVFLGRDEFTLAWYPVLYIFNSRLKISFKVDWGCLSQMILRISDRLNGDKQMVREKVVLWIIKVSYAFEVLPAIHRIPSHAINPSRHALHNQCTLESQREEMYPPNKKHTHLCVTAPIPNPMKASRHAPHNPCTPRKSTRRIVST